MNRKRVVRAVAVCLAAALFGAVLYAYHLSNPRIEIPAQNRARLASVGVLVDGTDSIKDIDFKYSKEIVVKRIIPNIGIGDRLTVYSVGPEFGLQNSIAGTSIEEQPPQGDPAWRRDALNTLSQGRSAAAPGRVRTQLYRLVADVKTMAPQVAVVRSQWSKKVQDMKRPRKSGTNLACALTALDADFKSNPSVDETRWLFVMSDMVQSTPCAQEFNAGLLSGVKVVLLYPFQSDNDSKTIIASWEKIFGRQLEAHPLSAALNEQYLLPPSPFAGLERYSIRGFWSNLVGLVY